MFLDSIEVYIVQIVYLILTILVLMVLGYFIGGIPTALLISKSMGIDIRKYGSHNAGGTNVGRVIGKKQGILVIVLDILKCYLPCLAVLLIFSLVEFDFLPKFGQLKELLVSLTAISCCIGHTFTPYAHFKGGKSVACFAGYILLVSPLIALVGMAIFFSCLRFAKRVSVGSILGVPCCFVVSLVPTILDFTAFKDPNVFNGGAYLSSTVMLHITYLTSITCLLLSVLVVIRHYSNIQRLKKGEEPETHFRHSVKGENLKEEIEKESESK